MEGQVYYTMKIHFLTTGLSELTGGAIYDSLFYKKLRARFGDNVVLIDDNFFSSSDRISFVEFSKIYRQHALRIIDCDYLIINSRLYTRFLTFPWRKLKKSKCKLIAIHHHFNFNTNHGYRRIIHKFFEMKLIKQANTIITPDPYIMDQLDNLGLKNKSIMIESYLSNKTYRIDAERKNQILFVGTVESRKGLTYGIQAFFEFWKTHKEYKYFIAGRIDKNDGYYGELEKLVNTLGIEDSVVFLGRISDEEKKKLYSESKVLLFPSQNEGYGWVLIEAMSFGMPVVAFNNTAIPYTVNNDNGAIVENKNIREMSLRLSEIIDDSDLYKRLVYGAYKTVESLPKTEDIDLEYEHFFGTLDAK